MENKMIINDEVYVKLNISLNNKVLQLLEKMKNKENLNSDEMIEECISTYYLRNKILKEITNNYKEILEVNNKKE